MGAGTSLSGDTESKAAVYRLHCLGNFRLARLADDADLTPKGRKARALIAYLAFNDAPAGRERLAGLLWGERGEEQARASLRNTLLELRALSADEHALLSVERDHVGLVPGCLTTDLKLIDEQAAQGDFAAIDRCLSHWNGKLFADLDSIDSGFDEWLSGERVRQRERLLATLAKPLGDGLASERSEAARSIIAKLIQVDPANETVVQLAMRADHLAGDVSAIRRHYQRLQEQLRAEFNAQPSTETQRLHEELVSSVGVTAAPVDSAAPSVGPRSNRRSAGTTAVSSMLSRSVFPLVAIAVLGALAIVALTVSAQWSETPEPAQPPSVAVLPFENLSGDPGLNSLSDGISAEIHAALVRYRTGMRIAGMVSGSRVRGAAKDYGAIRKALGVTHVFEGSVMRQSGRVRITVQLVDAREGAVLWTETFDRGLERTLEIQAEVARQMARVLRVAAPVILASRGSIPAKALDHYLRGMTPLPPFEFDPHPRIEPFEAATREAPDFASAWAILAIVYRQVSRWQDETEQAQTIQKARQAAQRAATLDPGLAVAHAALAGVEPNWNWHARAAHFKRAFAVRGGSDVHVLVHWSVFLMDTGRIEDMRLANRQMIALDPLSADARQQSWHSLLRLGHVQDAEDALRSFTEQDPAAATQWVRFFIAQVTFDVDGARRALVEIENNQAAFENHYRMSPQAIARRNQNLRNQLARRERDEASDLATGNQRGFEQLAHERLGQACATTALLRLADEGGGQAAMSGATAAAGANIGDPGAPTLPRLADKGGRRPRLDLAWRIAETLYIERGYVGTRGRCGSVTNRVHPQRQTPTYPLFARQTASLRHDLRIWRVFKAVGLAQFWLDTDKWPDFCAETDLPYDCKAEAKKAVAAAH